MYIWFALLIPVFATIFLYIFFTKRIVWWQPSAMLLVIIALIGIIKCSTELSQTTDTEYHQEYVVFVQYDEEWNEWIVDECTRECCCVTTTSTDSKGVTSTNTTCGTETYDCSYLKTHDAEYQVRTNIGNWYSISREEYFRLLKQFKATQKFTDMERNYHTIDGDRYSFYFNPDLNTIEPYTTTHRYENRIQASHSILNFQDVDTSDIKYFKLKDYPEVQNMDINSLLGYNNPIINKYINQTNSVIASKKQVKVFYLIFEDVPIQAGLTQEQYWKGGNKNEVVICIGIDKKKNIKWCYPFTWSKKDEVKVKIRNYINDNICLTDSVFKNIINHSHNVILKDFERRHFKEFSYITIEPSDGAVIWCYVLSFILTGIMSFVFVQLDVKTFNNFNNYSRRY